MKLYFSQCYNNIHAMKTHIDLVQNINSHIWAMLSCRPAVTFLDIYRMIEVMCGNGQQRLLGPMTKIPIIKSCIFGGVDINFPTPDIRLSDLICDCANFLTEKLAARKKTDEIAIVNAQSEKQFLHYLLKKYHINDFNLLGVKIVNFKALRDAAYAAKGDSFHKLIVSDKLLKLMRSDVKTAIKNIRASFSTSAIFQVDNKPLEDLSSFANLPFQDAIKQFFQPFLDEEARVFNRHNIAIANREEREDSLATIRNIVAVLLHQKLYGQLFQLAAIAGSMHELNTQMRRPAALTNGNSESWKVLVDIDVKEWGSRIFGALLDDVNAFNQLYLSHNDTPASCLDQLASVLKRIVEKCLAISQLFGEVDIRIAHGWVQPYKQKHLISLAACCRTVTNLASQSDCLKNSETRARLQLDLLPQVHHLLILVMSRSALSRETVVPVAPDTRVNSQLVDCVFTDKLWHYITENAVTQQKFSLQSVLKLERDVLDALNVSSWPLDGSFVSYFCGRNELVRAMVEWRGHASAAADSVDGATEEPVNTRCRCVALHQEFLQQIMRQQPVTVSFERFLTHTLPTMHGIVPLQLDDNSEARKQLVSMWDDHTFRQGHLLADGLPPAMDIRGNVSNNTGVDMGIITDSERVMRAISAVPLLDNAPLALQWNSLYRNYWGDICQFVNDHPQLSAALNVRLLHSEMGVIRVKAAVTVAEIDGAIEAILNEDAGQDTEIRQLIGQIVSLLLSPMASAESPEISAVLDALATHFRTTTTAVLGRFCVAALSFAPPELIVDIGTKLVHPLAMRVLDLDSAALAKILVGLDGFRATVLRNDLPVGHALLSAVARDRKELQTVEKPANQRQKETANAAIIPAVMVTEKAASIDEQHHEEMDDDRELSMQIEPRNEAEDGQLCRSVVEDIRVNEYGVGASPEETGVSSGLVASFNRKMARLVEHLSSDLYGNASHFVLELVQNADDNRYSSGTLQPTLELCWMHTPTMAASTMDPGLVLIVRNNETGFTERDLRSLCDIGASTKGTNGDSVDTGKIGRKGIGFKSVFLVSDRPEIHSNGFHVLFERYRRDETNKRVKNNALVPAWCDAPEFLEQQQPGTNTTILLPIRASLARGDIRQSVAGQLVPHLLLFLRNLTRITVVSSDSGQVERSIELVDSECSPNRKVVLTDSGERHCWFVCSRRLPVTEALLRQLSPRGLSHTELAIAISDNASDDQESAQDWPAFAFLPIRSYGLRFIVNADFAIPASREDIVHASAWNKWLIGRLGDMFTEHVRDSALSFGDGVVTAAMLVRLIECVPLPGEVPGDSSFHALIPQLRAALSALTWLPDRLGRLRAPSQLIAESLSDASGGLTALLCERLQLSLLHPCIAGCGSERVTRVLSWLGCQSLSLLHLSKLLATLSSSDFADRALMKSVIIALHGALDRDALLSTVTTQRVMLQLGSLPIWPVIYGTDSEQSLVSITNSPAPVFLPAQLDIEIDPFYRLRRVISPSFLAAYDASDNTQQSGNVAISILQRLGVPELSSASMISRAISPVISPQPKPAPTATPSRDWLISAAHFLLDQCHPSQYLDTIIPKLSFATVAHNSHTSTPVPTISDHRQLSQTHLAPPMETPHSAVIPLLRNTIDYATIDEAYLRCSTLRPIQWREFFLAAGACETLYEHNATFPEIRSLLELNKPSVNADLLRYIDRNWTSFPAESRSGPLLAELESRECIPVCTVASQLLQGQGNEDKLPMRRPRATVVLYLSSGDPNRPLMPDSLLPHFPVCPVVFCHDVLPQRIGMSPQVALEHISALLRDVLVTRAAQLSSEQARDLYGWLQRQLSPAALSELFSSLRASLDGALLLAVPDPSGPPRDPSELVLDSSCYWTLPIGDSRQSVFLQDQQVLEDLQQLLQPSSTPHRALVNVFPELHDLFVDVMHVRQFPAVTDVWPTLENLLRLLSRDRLSDHPNHAEIELVTDVYNVVQFLDQHDDNGRNRTELLQLPLIPCIDGGFRAFSEHSDRFSIYAWRSYATVVKFQEQLSDDERRNDIDFLAINCFPQSRRDGHSYGRAPRWSAPQFLQHYFNLPVLEDSLCFRVDNRAAFEPCGATKLMLANLEVIVSQWFQRNVNKDGVAHCVNMLHAITEFCSSPAGEDVAVSVNLRQRPLIGYRFSDSVYIGPLDNGSGDGYQLLLAGGDLREGGMSILARVMDALIEWILVGDCFSHQRDRFRKFYRSLFDLIESSDRNQVSIFIRSHNLRINPFSIDYIYETFASAGQEEDEEEEEGDEGARSVLSDGMVAIDDGVPNSPAARSDRSDRSLKRRVCVSIETSGGPAKKQRRIDAGCDNVTVAEPEVEAELEDGEDREEEMAMPVNRQLELRVTVPNTGGGGGGVSAAGRSSPLSMRVREQFTSQKQVSLRTAGAGADNVAHISGRIGEQLAFEKLSISQCLGEWEIVRVDWVNQHAESRLPYDFKLSARRPDNGGVTEVIYLEVKATTQPNKRQFDLSPQEVTAAWSFKEYYHLLLVFHSGQYPDDGSGIKFVHIPDTLGQLQDDQCKLLLDVGELLDE